MLNVLEQHAGMPALSMEPVLYIRQYLIFPYDGSYMLFERLFKHLIQI